MEAKEASWLDSESQETAIEGEEEGASWFYSKSWETAIEGEAEGISQLEDEEDVHAPKGKIFIFFTFFIIIYLFLACFNLPLGMRFVSSEIVFQRKLVWNVEFYDE